MFTEVRAGSTVGANQLANVRWSVVFDDVELTAAEIARLAKQARPMVQSRGTWVEIDRLDLMELADRAPQRVRREPEGALDHRHLFGVGPVHLAEERHDSCGEQEFGVEREIEIPTN